MSETNTTESSVEAPAGESAGQATQETPSHEETVAAAFDEGMAKLESDASGEIVTTEGTESASGDEAAGTTEGEGAAIPGVAKPTFDDKQTNLLKRAGLDPEVMKTLPEGERTKMIGQLDKMFKGIGQTLAEKGRAAREAAAAGQQQQQQQVAGNGAPAPAQAQQQQTAASVLKLDPNLLGEEATKALEAYVSPLITRLNAVTEQLNQSNAIASEQQRETMRRNVDDLFSRLSENHAAYGKGDFSGLKAEQIEARKTTLKLADDIWLGAKLDNKQMKVEDAIRLAHDALTAQDQVKQTKTKIAQQITARRSQFGQRPIGRKTVEQLATADQRAAQAFNEGAKAIGLRD